MAGQASTSSADSQEIKELHVEMVLRLGKFFTPNLESWEDLLTSLEPYLEPAELRGKDINSFGQICNNLMRKGVINYGSYSTLYKVIKRIDVRPAEIIQETSDSIKAIHSRGPSEAKQPRTGDQTQADVSTVKEDVGVLKEKLDEMAAAMRQICDINPKLAGLIETTEAMILKEKESFKFVPTKSLQDAYAKLLKNRIVIIKGNTGDGKTSIALELLRLLCNDEEEGQQKRCRRPLELHDMKDLDLVKPRSHLVIYLDDIFGTNVVCVPDVKEWEKRKKSVLAILDGKDDTEANFLVITIRSGILNSLNDSSLEEIFTEQNFVDLNNYKDEDEKLELLRLYKPKDQFISWTDDEEREIVECAPDIGFPQCCRLFRDTPTLHTERVDFFRRPFHFMKSSLSKLEDGKFYALLYLFLIGGEVMEDDLDPYNENIDETLLEAAFAVDVVKVTPTRALDYHKGRKLEFVKESLDCLLSWLVKKESIQKQRYEEYYPGYKFNHDSIEETVALLYGEKTPTGYIQNCPIKSLSYVTTSKTTPNRIVISSDGQTKAMYKRLVREFESVDSGPDDDWYTDRYQPITSLDVWTDTQFLQGFIRWLSGQNVDKNLCHQIKLQLLNEACSSGAEECALYLLSEGVEPDKYTPFCVVEGGSMNLLHKLLEYDVTPTARAEWSRSSYFGCFGINVLHEAYLCEREEMVTVLCDKYPHLVHDTGDDGRSTLHLVAGTGNCGIFHRVERTVRKSLCRVEDEQHKCETVDGRVVHRSCVCAQYMSQLVNVWGGTVLHESCRRGHREMMLYICESFPALTTVVDKCGRHCLHHIAELTSDVDLFTECETHVKRYLESTGREYDITAILDNYGMTVLHKSCVYGHRELMLYICESFPALTTVVDRDGRHCLHHIARCTTDVDLFTECETHVKRYLESTGREYDITAILTDHGETVLHASCRSGHRELMLYICESFPALTTVVDMYGGHCLHHIASFTTDVDLFTECETHVKRYLESTGREYDITAILTNRDESVLDWASYRGTENNPLYDHLVRLFSKH